MPFVKDQSDTTWRSRACLPSLWRSPDRAALHKALVKNNGNTSARPAAMRQTSAATLANH